MDTYTANLGLVKAADDSTDWGTGYRANLDVLDQTLGGVLSVVNPGPIELRLDYGTRTDDSPVMLGKAPAGTAETASVWAITTFTYASPTDNARLLSTDVRTGLAWAAR